MAILANFYAIGLALALLVEGAAMYFAGAYTGDLTYVGAAPRVIGKRVTIRFCTIADSNGAGMTCLIGIIGTI
jgi:hypothetical protein